MSVISNKTELHFYNKTNYFVEVIFNGEQNSNLNINHNDRNVMTKTQYSLLDYMWSYVFGEDTNLVHMNLLPKNKISLIIKCNSNLFFQIHPKIKSATTTDIGDFVLNTEYQNTKIDIEITESLGIGYTENGDVAINNIEPMYRDLVINTTAYIDSEALELKYSPAFCKMNVK